MLADALEAVIGAIFLDGGYPGAHEVISRLFAGRIAGCLLVSSTQNNYFLPQSRLALIENYANLLALAFEPEEFYEPCQIELNVMPNQEIQKKHFANFRQRVANTMMEGAINKRPVNNLEAERLVWQQLEEELLRLPARV